MTVLETREAHTGSCHARFTQRRAGVPIVPTMATQSAVRLPTPSEVPRYRLVSRIATGGMSEVFLALMPGPLGSVKPVVLKRLWPELANDPAHVQLFLDEARISLQMAHPNVVHAFESGIDGDRHFLALEYLDGQSLKHLVEASAPSGGLSVPLAIKIVCDVLTALEYVHNLTDLSGAPLHIVHRDVSPQNVFITYEGNVKLVDFGIAQFGDAPSPLARQGKGRVVYMAPEQVAGDPVDARADIFSVGVMLWELAAGRRLWDGMTEAQVTDHLRARLPLPTLPRNRGFPPGLAAVCAKALAPDPDQRYQHASQLLFDLGQLLTGSMPIHTRLLGDLMCRLFSHSRTLSRAMLQQGLPNGRATGEISTATPLPELGVVSDRTTSTSIAVPGDEVTLVDVPVPKPTGPRPRYAVRVAVGMTLALGLLAAGMAMGRSVATPRPLGAPPPALVVAAAPSEISPQPAPVVVPIEPAVEKKSDEPSAERADRAKRSRRRAAPSPSLQQAAPLPAPAPIQVVPRPTGRHIDREDPYGP